jgi:glycosyltransferase involved in cell wall biosynthesis
MANEFTGLGRYTLNLLRGLLAHPGRPPVEVIIDSPGACERAGGFSEIARQLGSRDRLTRLDAPLFGLRHHLRVGAYENSRADALYFYPHFDVPISLKRPALFVVHDLSPLADPHYLHRQRFLRRGGFRALLMQALARPGAECVTVSEATKADIARYISRRRATRIRVVPNAPCVSTAVSNASTNHLGLPERFLLYVGDRRPNKNLPKMIEIFRLLRDEHGYPGHFVIAGSRRNFSVDLDALVAEDTAIRLIGPVDEKTLGALYRRMECLFFLSTYEGFGMPVLEAATFNKKIVTSSVAALPEVAPPSALLMDPHASAQILVHRIVQYLADNRPIDNAEHCARFSWTRTAEAIFQLPAVKAVE